MGTHIAAAKRLGTKPVIWVTVPEGTPRPLTTENTACIGQKAEMLSIFRSGVSVAWSQYSHVGNQPPFAKHQWMIGPQGEILVWGSNQFQHALMDLGTACRAMPNLHARPAFGGSSETATANLQLT